MAKKSRQTFLRSPLFIAIAAFIILFVGFWGFYSKNYNSNTNQTATVSDETADWKTYSTSGKFGLSQETLIGYNDLPQGNIEIKYPPSWHPKSFESQSMPRYGLDIPFFLEKVDPRYTTPGEDSPPYNYAQISFQILKTDKSLGELGKEKLKGFQEAGYKNLSIEKKSINGRETAELKIQIDGHFEKTIILPLDSENILIISAILAPQSDDKEYVNNTINEINQILSTFKFTD